jgi:hypothetical protein
MGRALWLRGRQDEALGELEQAVARSPNFALGTIRCPSSIPNPATRT